MTDSKNFRRQFWKDRKMVGSMTPSSKYLTQKMTQNIDFTTSHVIVELGPGTGVFTDEIIRKMPDNGTLLAFELNELFFRNLKNRITDPRVHVIHDSAEHIEKYLEEYKLDKADVILSSLPLAVFPEALRMSVLTASKNALKPNGQYIQFQYSLQAKRLLKKFFIKMDIQFTPLNFPPAFVYTCKMTKD